MTPTKRAEKIWGIVCANINYAQGFTKSVSEITAQIEEAEKEAVENFKATSGIYCPKCGNCGEEGCDGPHQCEIYLEGFRAAKEKAKGVAEKEIDRCFEDSSLRCRCPEQIAQRIGEMEP